LCQGTAKASGSAGGREAIRHWSSPQELAGHNPHQPAPVSPNPGRGQGRLDTLSIKGRFW